MKAVILDMYGVVVTDSGDDLYRFIGETFPELTVQEMHRIWCGMALGEYTAREAFEKWGYRQDIERVERDYLETLELAPDFYAFAGELKKSCKLALLSDDGWEWSRFLREKFDLDRYFDAAVISGEVKIKKPDPAIFRMVLERLGCAAEDCVYVDDRPKNVLAARALGMDGVLFGDEFATDDRMVYSFSELAALLGIGPGGEGAR